MKSEYSVTLTSKGQLVIPAELRRKLGMRKGTRVAITQEKGRLILQPITNAFIDSLKGCLKGSGVFEHWEREHKREARYEDLRLGRKRAVDLSTRPPR